MVLTGTTAQLIYLITAISSFGIGGYLLNINKKGIKYIGGLNIALGVWIISIFFSVTIQGAIGETVARLMYFGFAATPTLLLIFALKYSGNDQYLTRKIIIGLSIHPILTGVFALTNPFDAYLLTATPTDVGIIEEWGWLYWIMASYSYVLIGTSGVLIGRFMFTTNHTIYTGQAAIILIAIIIGLVSNLYYAFTDIVFNTSAVGATIASILFTITITEYELTKLTPVARRKIIDDMRDGIIVINDNNVISDVNTSTKNILGYKNEFVGKNINDVITDDHIIDGIKTVLNNNTNNTMIEHNNKHIKLKTSEIKNKNQGDIGTLILIQDVTQLQNQKIELQEQNDRLDEFAATVAHDLRNPLNAAKGFTERALNTGKTDHLDIAVEEQQRMMDMVEDLLTLARSGNTIEEREQINIYDAIDDAWTTAETDDTTLEVNLPEEIIIEADENRVLHLFENLFRNAADHNEQPLTVRVGTIPETTSTNDPDGLYVEDTGSGIPEEKREEVFEHGHTTSEKGTGFGLSIIDDIVEAHNWEITVTESTEGGARFEITGIDSISIPN